MKLRKSVFATLFSVFVVTTLIHAQDPPTTAADFVFDHWKEYVSKDGVFRILMPGIPSEVSQAVNIKPGSAAAHFVALTTKTAEYSVGFTTFPSDLENLQSSKITLDGIRNRVLVKESGKLLFEEDVSIEGHPGRALVIEVSDGVFRDQYFLVKNRLYTLTVFTPAVKGGLPADTEGIRKAHEAIAKRFMGSFKLLIK